MYGDKGKGVMLYPQQQALQDSHDAMMSHARDRLRYETS